MDAVKFSKYLQTSVMPLYTYAQDTPVKRVLIIVESGPDQLDLDMLATLGARGFYLMASVPNTLMLPKQQTGNMDRLRQSIELLSRSSQDSVRLPVIPSR